MEGTAVLNGDAHIPGGLQDVIHGLAGALAPAGAVQEEHVGALGTADLHAAEAGVDVAAGQLHILVEDPAQLLQPRLAGFAVTADEGVLTEHILTVVVAISGYYSASCRGECNL